MRPATSRNVWSAFSPMRRYGSACDEAATISSPPAIRSRLRAPPWSGLWRPLASEVGFEPRPGARWRTGGRWDRVLPLRLARKRMGTRRRLLFVTDVFPFPLDRGQRVRIHNLLIACSRAFDVTFLGPPPPAGSDGSPIEKSCSRAVYLKHMPRGWSERLSLAGRTARLAPGMPKPSTIEHYAPLVAALRDLRPETFDLVWAERPHIGRVCADVRARTILDLDDIEHLKTARLLKLQTDPVARVKLWYRFAFYRHLELSWSRRFLA